VRYETNIDRLNIQAMAGASQESYRYQWFTASKLDLTAPELTELNAATADASATGNYTNWAMHSYFGRLALNWEEKYLLEANLRVDKSSRFAPGSTRRGIFPSFSAGWRISEEEFLRSVSWLNNLKLRLSYGGLGNNTLGSNRDNDGNYSWQRFYTAQNYVFNNAVQIGFAQTALSNALLTWETTYVSNLGIDFGLLKSRLNGSIDVFVKNTEGILIDLPAPLVHGNSSIPRKNAAEVRNTGTELNLTWSDKIGEVGYFVGGNFSYIKNKVTKFKGSEPSISGTNMILEGEPINIQYVLLVDRLIQTDEDLAIVQAMVDQNPDAFTSYKRPEKGDFLYKDVSGVGADGLPDGIPDGRITDADRVKIGNGTNPTTTYGINFGFNWRGIDFSCLLQGIGGLKVYWDGADAATFWPQVRRGNQLNKTITDGRWYEGRTDATYPRLLEYSDSRNRVASDFWLQDKSYMRVKNIQLGYTLPRHLSQRLLLETLRIYAGIDNALTFTNYQGLDPEVSGTNYPTIRTTTFGINLTF
jgi:TonB-linked SusC/RagA family outer membrane protein